MRRPRLIAVIFILIFGLSLSTATSAQDVPRITKEALRAMMGNADLVIIDVRRERDWKQSQSKIEGAVREDPESIATWASKYGKDKTYVLYCA